MTTAFRHDKFVDAQPPGINLFAHVAFVASRETFHVLLRTLSGALLYDDTHMRHVEVACLYLWCGAEELKELQHKEKQMNVQPDWEIDAFTKAQIRTGKRHSIVTDLILKLLGLDVCSHLLVI